MYCHFLMNKYSISVSNSIRLIDFMMGSFLHCLFQPVIILDKPQNKQEIGNEAPSLHGAK